MAYSPKELLQLQAGLDLLLDAENITALQPLIDKIKAEYHASMYNLFAPRIQELRRQHKNATLVWKRYGQTKGLIASNASHPFEQMLEGDTLELVAEVFYVLISPKHVASLKSQPIAEQGTKCLRVTVLDGTPTLEELW